MDVFRVLLYLAACVCFLIAAFFVRRANTNERARTIDLVALGLLFGFAVPLIDAFRALDN